MLAMKSFPIRLDAIAVSLMFCLIISACDDDSVNDNSLDGPFIWVPDIGVLKGNGSVSLILTDPRPYTDYIHPPTTPDYFDILVSDDMNNFTVYKTVDVTTTEVAIGNLVNDKPYYFSVASRKKGFRQESTDTVMTIPSPEIPAKPYFPDANLSVERISTSYD